MFKPTYILFFNSIVYHVTNPYKSWRGYRYTYCGFNTQEAMGEYQTIPEDYRICKKCKAKHNQT